MDKIGLEHVDYCFVCGKANPQGLKANFTLKDAEVRGEFTPKKHHQGPLNLLHGGLICALLDEAMATLINGTLATEAPTASLEVRFKNPARIDEKLIIKAQFLNKNSRIKTVQATIETERGTIVAKGLGKFLSNFKLAQ